MEVAVVPIMVPQGGEYEETFLFYEDEAKTRPKDLGVQGWSGHVAIRDKAGKLEPIVAGTVDTSEADQGKIVVRIDSATTGLMETLNHEEDRMVPRYNYVYTVVCESGGRRRWVMRGELALIPDPERA